MIKNLHLISFRNFTAKKFEFSSKVNVIIGPNASGKTNVLESIFLLSTGKSFKAKIEEEMVEYSSFISRVTGQIDNMSEKTKLEAVLTRGEIEVGDNKFEKAPRKKLLVNGISRRLIDFAGNLKVVLFGPWDMEIVTESPSVRRNFLDMVLSQVDREYRRASLSYEKGLRQRNRLLYRIREEGLSRSQLLFWDKLLIKNGDYITTSREKFIDFLNKRESINEQKFRIYYDKSAISEGRLSEYAAEEVAAATTLVGPHRDDFLVGVEEKESVKEKEFRDLARFGSRGEQRMGVLWLKLGELSYIEKQSIISTTDTNNKPTLLLDDIFSELDHEHREIVMSVCGNQQTIITTADPHYLESFGKVETIRLS